MYKRVHRDRLPRRCKIVLSTPDGNWQRGRTLLKPVENCRYVKFELNYLRAVIQLYENSRLLTSPVPADFTREL